MTRTPVDTVGAARRLAMDLLARREHSVAELHRKLAARGVEDGLRDAAVAALAAEGLVSDERYAESLLEGRLKRGKGPLLIRHELSRQGVEQSVIERTLAGCAADWVALARAARRKRFGTTVPGELRERARQARFLGQRGFTAEQIREALENG